MKRLFTLIALMCAAAASFGATLNPVQLLNPTGSTSGQAIVSTGASTAPAWSNVTATSLVAQAANTVVANATASSASPTAFSMPSCSGPANAIQWATNVGFICGTGYALLTSPTFTGTVTAANLTTTGSITPSQTAGIVGTTTNNNANAGVVGEFVSASSSAVSLTTNVTNNCTSTTLTAGDWDVTGVALFHPAGTTTINALMVGISTTSVTAGPLGTLQRLIATFQTGIDGNSLTTPVVRLSLTTNTAVYIVATAQFGASTMTCDGFIRARRVR